MKKFRDIVLAMAYNRETFRNKIEEKIVGALFEYAFVIMANQNNQTKWVEHKLFEVNRLLDVELVKELTHMISGFKDRRKAALDVFNHVEKVIKPKMSLAASNMYKGYYKQSPKINKLEYKDVDLFFIRVKKLIEDFT